MNETLGLRVRSFLFFVFPSLCNSSGRYELLPSVDKILKISFKKSWYLLSQTMHQASLAAQRVKRLPTMRETRVRSLGPEDPLEKEMATHSSTLVWKSHGLRSLVGYSPWGRKESDTTQQLHFTSIQSAIIRSRYIYYPTFHMIKHPSLEDFIHKLTFHKVKQAVSGKAGIWTQAPWKQRSCF